MTSALHQQNLHLHRIYARSSIIAAIRQFFLTQQFVEVDTPIALAAPAPEVAIEAIPVAICADHFGRKKASQRFLQTSPELAMKRLLAMGLTRIFQIAAVFRDGDQSQCHTPEFRLLEWYRVGAPLTVLMDDCEALVRAAVAATRPWQSCGIEPFTTPPGPWPRFTVDELFVRTLGFSVHSTPSAQELYTALEQQGVRGAVTDSWDDLFSRAFVERIEPALHELGTPVFVTHYPAAQAALARLDPQDPRVAERFELYAHGMELANAFNELTCAREQRGRFEQAQRQRAAAKMRTYPLDERFLTALDSMPQASGIALGIERLLMLCLGVRHIDDVAAVPFALA